MLVGGVGAGIGVRCGLIETGGGFRGLDESSECFSSRWTMDCEVAFADRGMRVFLASWQCLHSQ